MAFKTLETQDSHGGSDDTPFGDINIIPLVDVVLVLLIIFMVTVPMMKAGVDVSLPKGRNAAPIEQERTVIYFTHEKKVFIEQDPVHEAVLDDRVRALAHGGRAVYLQADRRLSYGEVMEFLDRLKGNGLESVALVMEDAPKPKGGGTAADSAKGGRP